MLAATGPLAQRSGFLVFSIMARLVAQTKEARPVSALGRGSAKGQKRTFGRMQHPLF
jgi:hypothetical protein